MAASFVPGGEAVLASVQSAGVHMPWGDSPPLVGKAAVGGGAGGGASDSAAAKGPGPGHRNTLVKGAMTEMIGGLHSVLTPGSIQWQTTGATAVAVGGSRSIKAVHVGSSVLGASSDTLGSFHIKTATDIERTTRGSVTTNVGGSLKSQAGAHHVITADSSVKLKVGGSLTMKGSHVTFVCGSSTVSASPGGVLIKASTITITGASKQSGETDHS
jgi:type VI secretion system secreted protein VgrG